MARSQPVTDLSPSIVGVRPEDLPFLQEWLWQADALIGEAGTAWRLLSMAANDSPVPLSEWVPALEAYWNWPGPWPRGRPDPQSALGFLSCCADYSQRIPFPYDLRALVLDMLETHGVG